MRTKGQKAERMHVTLPAGSREKLLNIQDRTGESDISAVIRRVVLVYAALIEEHQKGNEILIKSADGATTQYRLLIPVLQIEK